MWLLDPESDDGLPSAMYVEHRETNGEGELGPVVLIHGGGGQGTDWGTTPDGRPGWADLLEDRGHEVHVVDRPAHGRSPGRVPAPAALPLAARVFAPGDRKDHTEWPGPGGIADPTVRTLAISSSGLPAELAEAQVIEARLLVSLLEQIGPAVVVAHSLGACCAWLAAEARPELITAVVALEPAGPPYLDVTGTPLRLSDGITAAPLRRNISGDLAGLARVPVVVVEGAASSMAPACAPVVAFLRAAGVSADHLILTDHGVTGNGHGLQLELNNEQVLDLVLEWLSTSAPANRTGVQA